MFQVTHFRTISTASPIPLRCCLEVPSAYLPKAQYALRMLLWPLGIVPQWIARDQLQTGDLYYGPVETPCSPQVIRLALGAGVAAFFANRTHYAADSVRWWMWENQRWPLLFGGDTPETTDLVAATFFWLSGWQEYTTPERDVHARFPFSASYQAQWDTATRPAVDFYRTCLAAQLEAAGHTLSPVTWQGAPFALCPTHDIDYLRKWRLGLAYREVVPYLLRNTRRQPLAARLQRFRKVVQDVLRPGEVYREAMVRMQKEVAQRGGTATYFFKAGVSSAHDTPYALTGRFIQKRFATLREDGFEIGLHPSFYAHTHPRYLLPEKERLTQHAARPLRAVRQHYLRYETPTTGRLHEEAGFVLDSTLGFADHEGFRHATCFPFQLFDIPANRPLAVWEMPLAIMESVLFNRRGFSLAQANQATAAVLEACKRFGGLAILLWHNTLWDELDCPNWGQHFLDTLDAATAQGATILSLEKAWAACKTRATAA